MELGLVGIMVGYAVLIRVCSASVVGAFYFPEGNTQDWAQVRLEGDDRLEQKPGEACAGCLSQRFSLFGRREPLAQEQEAPEGGLALGLR